MPRTHLNSHKQDMSINNLPKSLVFAHIHICSLRNKTHELACFVKSNKVNVLTVSETLLDGTIKNSEVTIDCLSLFRKD